MNKEHAEQILGVYGWTLFSFGREPLAWMEEDIRDVDPRTVEGFTEQVQTALDDLHELLDQYEEEGFSVERVLERNLDVIDLKVVPFTDPALAGRLSDHFRERASRELGEDFEEQMLAGFEDPEEDETDDRLINSIPEERRELLAEIRNDRQEDHMPPLVLPEKLDPGTFRKVTGDIGKIASIFCDTVAEQNPPLANFVRSWSDRTVALMQDSVGGRLRPEYTFPTSMEAPVLN